MNIKLHENTKRVEIWVDSSEQQSYKEQEAYKNVVTQYKNTHSICVFVGGNKPLLPTITMLLDAQVKSRFSKVS